VEEMEMWAPSTRKVGQGGPARADGEDFFLEGAVDSTGLFRGAKSQPAEMKSLPSFASLIALLDPIAGNFAMTLA
jgi:hypothetical protein